VPVYSTNAFIEPGTVKGKESRAAAVSGELGEEVKDRVGGLCERDAEDAVTSVARGTLFPAKTNEYLGGDQGEVFGV
jgi:hypothetical protein